MRRTLRQGAHLFGFRKGDESYDEASFIEPGSQLVAGGPPFRRIALSICYDLRFPELYRALSPVDLILVPAAFTETTGRAHWEILLGHRPSRTNVIFSLSDRAVAMKTAG